MYHHEENDSYVRGTKETDDKTKDPLRGRVNYEKNS